MTGDTTGLMTFLWKQLDTDAARALQWHDLECDIHAHLDGGLLAAVAASRMLDEVPGAVCDCGGPARVLREVEAKRAVVARYEFACGQAVQSQTEAERETWVQVGGALQACVLLLAGVYEDRPGYAEAIASTG